VLGRRLAREKEGPATTMSEGSLKSLVFEAVVLPNAGRHEINQLSNRNSIPLAAALTAVKGIHDRGVHSTHSSLRRGPWPICMCLR